MNPLGRMDLSREEMIKGTLNYNDMKNRIMQEITQIRGHETKQGSGLCLVKR